MLFGNKDFLGFPSATNNVFETYHTSKPIVTKRSENLTGSSFAPKKVFTFLNNPFFLRVEYYRNVITKLKSLIGVIAIVEDEEVCWEPLAALHSSEVGLEQALPLNMLKERCSRIGQEDERESFL